MRWTAAAIALCISLYCLASVNADNLWEHFGTKASYWSELPRTDSTPPSMCVPRYMNAVIRHGSRYPTDGDMESILHVAELVDNYGSLITNASFAWIKQWHDPYELINAGVLSYAGEMEQYAMARRLRERYLSLLSQEYYPYRYILQSTQVSRTGESASAFAYGLTEDTGVGVQNFEPVFVFTESKDNDRTLRFFDACGKYVEAIDTGVINTDEADQWWEEHYEAIGTRIAATLGIGKAWNITSDELDSLFTMCAFEASLFNITNHWCTLFEEDELETFLYMEDLANWAESGYGNSFNYRIAAPLLQDMFARFDGVIEDPKLDQLAYLRFAHAETVLPLVSLLGLFHDATNWTAQSPPQLVAQRQWRTGVISPFSANVILLLYTCSDGPRVKLLHNEGEYVIPGCNGEIYCPYDTFKRIYAEPLAFNWDATCNDAKGIPVVSDDSVLSSFLTLPTLTAVIFSLLIGFGLGVVFRSLRPSASLAYAAAPVVEEANL